MEVETTIPVESESEIIADVSVCLAELAKKHEWKESLRKEITFSNRSFWVALVSIYICALFNTKEPILQSSQLYLQNNWTLRSGGIWRKFSNA